MAVTFKEILEMPVEVYLIDGIRAAYIDLRIDRSTLPDGIHAYDVRDTSDDGGCYIGRIEDLVIVNHAGTMLSRKPLRMLHPESGSGGVYAFLDDDGDEWHVEDAPMMIGDFLKPMDQVPHPVSDNAY